MSAEPLVRLLLQEIQTKQSAHAVADDGDRLTGGGGHLLHQTSHLGEVLGLRLGSVSEVVRSGPATVTR